jgi:glycogen phosphorylase
MTDGTLPGQAAPVAYFSMEIGLQGDIPTYSGGLGVLAGDTLRSAADVGLPMVGITLAHRKGYFRQRLDAAGHQSEADDEWHPEQRLEPASQSVTIHIHDQPVQIRAWRYVVQGSNGSPGTVYLLDTRVPGNAPEHQALTDHLYGGDLRYRLAQEAVLGIGGLKLLRALGYTNIRAFHMNEGHSALLTIALLEEELEKREAEGPNAAAIEAVRRKCVFTTHTPVAAGHDKFDIAMVREHLGDRYVRLLEECHVVTGGELNMTRLALLLSRRSNAVAFRHGQVSREMFPGFEIKEITNGVHAVTWVAPAMQELFDHYIPGWRQVPFAFRHAIGIPLAELRRAHTASKLDMIEYVRETTGVSLDPNILTIGFARRSAIYKRPELLFRDVERLKTIVRSAGPIQIVVSGKAHPADEMAKGLIRRVFDAAAELHGSVPVVWVENYDMSAAAKLVAGVDIWLNNPQRPLEASGTSGMKAAMNGVPSLSTLDGWWIEGHVEGVTGWAIGRDWEPASDHEDADALYNKLELTVVPMFYRQPEAFAEVMRSSIALNGSFFNAQRMILQYSREMYAS